MALYGATLIKIKQWRHSKHRVGGQLISLIEGSVLFFNVILITRGYNKKILGHHSANRQLGRSKESVAIVLLLKISCTLTEIYLGHKK